LSVLARNPPVALSPSAGPGDGDELVIVTEQAGEMGGTERVLSALIASYPRARLLAPRFERSNVPAGAQPEWDSRVVELGRARRKLHHLAPVYARWVAAAPIERARVVLTLVHGGWAAAAPVPSGARHVSYCAGPPRALYGQEDHYLRAYPAPARPFLRAALPPLRAHYRALMRRSGRLLTNSLASAAGLERLVGQRAEVVYPPVRTDFFTPGTGPREHFLAVARVTPQKRIDVLVDAFRGLDERLVVVGGGPWLDRLRAAAPPNVSFAGYVSDDELLRLYRRSHAVVCPSVEEFGIVMVEAHACGTPVVAPRAGGALEIVADGATGLLVDRLDAESVRSAVRAIRGRAFDARELRASAERFSVDRFASRMDAILAEEHALSLAPR
jgi:glycosyltransferase involved in cell wall biosynthesis